MSFFIDGFFLIYEWFIYYLGSFSDDLWDSGFVSKIVKFLKMWFVYLIVENFILGFLIIILWEFYFFIILYGLMLLVCIVYKVFNIIWYRNNNLI